MADIKEKIPDTAVFVAVASSIQNDVQVNEYLDELIFLAKTAGIEGNKKFIQHLDHPNTRSYVGPGKLIEIIDYAKNNNIVLYFLKNQYILF